jgi:hypothetical protein
MLVVALGHIDALAEAEQDAFDVALGRGEDETLGVFLILLGRGTGCGVLAREVGSEVIFVAAFDAVQV